MTTRRFELYIRPRATKDRVDDGYISQEEYDSLWNASGLERQSDWVYLSSGEWVSPYIRPGDGWENVDDGGQPLGNSFEEVWELVLEYLEVVDEDGFSMNTPNSFTGKTECQVRELEKATESDNWSIRTKDGAYWKVAHVEEEWAEKIEGVRAKLCKERTANVL